MSFWTSFWLFAPPLILVLAGVLYYFLTAPSDSSSQGDS